MIGESGVRRAALRVAATQFALRPEPHFAGFREHFNNVVESAVEAGATLVVLPELVTMGLLASHPNASGLEAADMASVYREVFPALADKFEEAVRTIAVEHSIWLLGGSHWRAKHDGTFVNTAYLAHPDGRIESQDKLHLTPPEVAIDTATGASLLVTSVAGIKTGVLVCADIQFPEISRHLVVSHDVELLLCPSLTWNSRGVNRIRYSSHARALENQVFVVTSTLVGTCGIPIDRPLYGKGDAFIACPIDRVFGRADGVLAATRGDGDRVAVAELDFDQLAASRANPEPPGLSNLRPDFYEALTHAPA